MMMSKSGATISPIPKPETTQAGQEIPGADVSRRGFECDEHHPGEADDAAGLEHVAAEARRERTAAQARADCEPRRPRDEREPGVERGEALADLQEQREGEREPDHPDEEEEQDERPRAVAAVPEDRRLDQPVQTAPRAPRLLEREDHEQRCGGGLEIGIFRIRPFFVENLVLGASNIVFIPVFFFASEYAQIALGKSASSASLVLLYFFLGFVAAAQVGGRMLDRIGAKRPVVLGCVVAAVGFWLWAGKLTGLHFGSQIGFVILSGAGMGLMLGPASTDAVNRASRLSYGEATGITQTVRNYAASLGLAVLGSFSVSVMHSHLTTSLVGQGLPHAQANAEATRISQAHSSSGGSIPHFVRLDFAEATKSVFHAMALVMAVAAVIAFAGLRRGVQEA